MQIVRLIVFVLLLSPVLNATDVKKYRELYKNGTADQQATMAAYLLGIAEGYGWANAELAGHRKQPPLYCVPTKLALHWQNYEGMIDDQIGKFAAAETAEKLDQMQVEILLLHGLMETFPCSDKAK